MGLCRFCYPSDKLLLVSSLYPSRGEKVESQRRENLSLSLFPSFPIRLVLRSDVVNVVTSLAHALAFARYSLTVSSQEIGPKLVTPG